MPRERGGDPDREQHERWTEQLFGEFEHVRWEAEALREELVVHSLPRTDRRVLALWAKAAAAYERGLNAFARKDDDIPADAKQALRETFDAHVEELEACFGRKFRLLQ